VINITDQNGIAVLAVNNPPVNTINAAVRAALFKALDQIGTPKALVLLCEGSTFFSGADIGEFSGPPQEVEYRRLFNAIENLPFPVVAAMHGTVMGGGLEIALASHYRVAAPGTRFGLPEVTLGIIPGAGGTQRMPRLIGVEKTLELVLGARPVDAARAIELGFLDQIVEGDLRAAAVAFASAKRAPRRTGELQATPASEEAVARFTAQARKQYRNQPAPLTAIKAIVAAATMPLAQGLEYETELANAAKATTESKALVHVFFAEREARRIPGIGPEVQARVVKSAAIVGAGTMGGGIAICFANAGIPVTVLDASREGLDRGLAAIEKTYASMVQRGRLAAADRAKRLALINGVLDYDSLKNADVVIEAVFEDPRLKKEIFARLDAMAKPGAILATNTSSLKLADIATALKDPSRLVGIHFFNPVPQLQLVEVVSGANTDPELAKKAAAFVRHIDKLPLPVKDSPGFLVNRVLGPYMQNAFRMLDEGVKPETVDAAMEEFGMPMGPAELADTVGLDICLAAGKALARPLPGRRAGDPGSRAEQDVPQVLANQVALGHLGRKTGRGIYRYENGRAVKGRPDAYERALIEALIEPYLAEAKAVLAEGIVADADLIDAGLIFGTGFAPFRGGPLHHLDSTPK